MWWLRRLLYRDSRPARSGRGRRRSRPMGCLIWAIVIFLVLLALSITFGGFHQGTKALGPAHPTSVALALTAGRLGG